jgi:hypothetical protein
MRIIPKGDANTTGIWIRDYDLAEETLLTQSMPELNLILGLLRGHQKILETRIALLESTAAAHGYSKWPGIDGSEMERAKNQLQLVTAMLRDADGEDIGDEED